MSIKQALKWVTRILPDSVYISLAFFRRMGRFPNLRTPKTYTEKLQWIKLHDHRPLYTKIVDKYEVRGYVADKIGSEYLIPLVGGPWESFDDIDFEKLPNQFVLKCTHDSGGLVICKSKSSFDKVVARKVIEQSLRQNYFWQGREWPYKKVRPRIIAEQYMEDGTTHELRDYKFFTFNGKAKLLFVASERQKSGVETKFDFFDMEYTHLDMRNGHPNASVLPEKPQNFPLMIDLTEQLAKGFPQLRVDLYEVNGFVYFGELTLFHWSGMIPFDPPQWDRVLGEWISLPEENK